MSTCCCPDCKDGTERIGLELGGPGASRIQDADASPEPTCTEKEEGHFPAWDLTAVFLADDRTQSPLRVFGTGRNKTGAFEVLAAPLPGSNPFGNSDYKLSERGPGKILFTLDM